MSTVLRPPPQVLIADADLEWATEVAARLRAAGYAVETSPGGTRLSRVLEEREFAVVLCDSATANLETFADARGSSLPPAVILLAGLGSVHEAVEAMRAGAFDYICKPASEEQILVSVTRAIEQRALRDENRRLKADLRQRFELGRMLSRDAELHRVFQTVDSLSATRATILVEGESGTGKTMLARAIHEHSNRSSAPFIEVNCGALPDTLLESELFGHTRGAFTGAVRDKAGKFEAAHGGTLFLDEIACASLDLQIKLLRVLQDRTFERLGETKTRTADVRVIAASNRDLAGEVAGGRFREDLYYRIHVVSLRLPPLRERPGDVALLAEHFLARFAGEYDRPAKSLHPDCLALLADYPWPGNVRELEHAIERAVLLCPAPELRPEDLAPGMASASWNRAARATSAPTAIQPVEGLEPRSLRHALEHPEREIIRRALEQNRGNRKATAAMLNVNRTTLFNKMRKYNLMDFPARPD